MSDTLDALLTAVGAAPALPGAHCQGRHRLFDPPTAAEDPDAAQQQRLDLAVELCRTCPALASCTRWVEELPARKRPRGVTAGQIRAERW